MLTSTTTLPQLERRSPTEVEGLPAYLNGHLAGETLGLALATRASSQHEGTPLGTFLKLLSWELEEDRESLLGLMATLGVRRKRAILARIPHLRLSGSSPLSTLASLDLRINDKREMWSALRSSAGEVGIDFDELIRRAERQAEALERRR